MKLIIITFTFFLFGKAYSQDSIAVRIVKNSLDTIRVFLERPHPKSPMNALIAADFLYELTGIAWSTGGSYAGSYPPDEKDLANWTAWYESNRKYFIFHKKTRMMIVDKKVKAPNYIKNVL